MALVILSLAVPAMLWGIGDATKKRVNPILSSEALYLAAEKLEDVIADCNSPDRLYAYVQNANYAAESSVTGFTNFARSVNVVETSPTFTAGTGCKTVTVTVTYTDGQGTSRSIALATVLTNYSP